MAVLIAVVYAFYDLNNRCREKNSRTRHNNLIIKSKDNKQSQNKILPVTNISSFQKGAALGLFSEDPEWSYMDMLKEMKQANVSYVSIVVPWYIKNSKSNIIFKHSHYTVPMHTVHRTVKNARSLDFKIFLFPILRVEDKSDGGWRGTLSPADIEAFYASYEEFILKFASLAHEMNIPLLSIGSELSSLDTDTKRWRQIIKSIKNIYKGNLTYSANWDHYEKIEFFDDLDYAGLTGYFELAENGANPTTKELANAWSDTRNRIHKWHKAIGKNIIFTEVGYKSQKNAAAHPWKEGADEPIDLELQRRCYEAFSLAWKGKSFLQGVYFWNWFGWGGADSKEYTPRNKPAAKEVQKYYSN